ncbi:hypothetical protein I4U23_005586 [Adineta vaga]|nr:hypothetical protein I4U23_005586 [Adineta vaga]
MNIIPNIFHYLFIYKQNFNDQQIEILLNKTIDLVSYMKYQDIFEEYYTQHLAEHLLSNQSISEDLEKYILSLLNSKFGNQFTSKLEYMLQNISLSDILTKDFQSYVNENKINLYNVKFSIRILKTGFWPISSLTNQCNLSPIIRNVYQDFQNFYLKKFNNRRLTLLSQFGSADLKIIFYNKLMMKEQKYILQISTYQMLISMLFNIKDYWSFKKIVDETNINIDDVEQTLISLSINKNILLKEPKNESIQLNDRFFVNDSFI